MLLEGFDSILVRLKVSVSVNGDPVRDCFDSILVRLKVAGTALDRHRPKRFRFHTGSIKRKAKRAPVLTDHRRFDSILVRLKVKTETPEAAIDIVSIPYWFD